MGKGIEATGLGPFFLDHAPGYIQKPGMMFAQYDAGWLETSEVLAMARRSVMDHTGDTRHYFDANDEQALREAEEWLEGLRTRGLGIFSSKNSSEARGLRLPRSWLSPEQRAQFDATRYFDAIGCDSEKRFRIHYGVSMNVNQIEADGHPIAGWCFVATGYLVAGDVMLAQKIALETNQFGALAVANTFLPEKNTV
jgi:hypothetical protein